MKIERWSLMSAVRIPWVKFKKYEENILPISVHELSVMQVGLVVVELLSMLALIDQTSTPEEGNRGFRAFPEIIRTERGCV